MASSPAVFIVDHDPDARYRVQQTVLSTGFTVAGQSGLGTEAVSQVAQLKPNIILCGLREPLQRVVQTIESIVHLAPGIPVVVYSDTSGLDMVRKAMLSGARDFLQTPLKPDGLKRSLTAALESLERGHLRESGNALLGPEGAVVTVYGAKGGIGKTAVAVNTAVALVRSAGQTAVLVDADDAFGDAADALGLTPERTIMDILAQVDGCDDDALRALLATHESGLAVVSAPAHPLDWRRINGEQLQTLIRRLVRLFDVVILDTAGTLSDVSQAALEAASIVLWVTTLEYASVRDSLQALQVLKDLNLSQDRVRVLLNVSNPETEVRPESIEEALGHQIFWTVPYDRLLRQSSQLGQPVVESHPDSAAARSVSGLALVLSGRQPEAHTANGRASLRQRLFGGRGTLVAGPKPIAVREEASP